jgi:hypothetical protein
MVSLQGQQIQTDANGSSTFTAQKPGKHFVSANKKHYLDTGTIITVGLQNKTYAYTITLQATGRPVPVVVTNKISGQPVKGALVVAGDTQVTTDDSGSSEMVLDAGLATATATVSAEGYITMQADLTASEDRAANTISLIPAGKVYVLSKQSGKLDVVKMNLDGTEREVSVPATGNEEVANTYIVPSSDWKFAVLHARRDSGTPALYLLDTANDKLTEIDTTKALYNVVGWSGHRLVYSMQRTDVADWRAGKQEIKQFDASSGIAASIDKTTGQGGSYENYAAEYYTNIHIVNNQTLYTKQWAGNAPDIAKKQNALYASKLETNQQQTVRSFGTGLISTKQPAPNQLYLEYIENQRATYYIYQNESLAESSAVTQAVFRKIQPQFFVSPGQNKTLWSEQVDGKYRTYVAGSDLTNKQIRAADASWMAYGWFGTDYILLSRADSELAVAHATEPADVVTPQKITNYHRPPNREVSF